MVKKSKNDISDETRRALIDIIVKDFIEDKIKTAKRGMILYKEHSKELNYYQGMFDVLADIRLKLRKLRE